MHLCAAYGWFLSVFTIAAAEAGGLTITRILYGEGRRFFCLPEEGFVLFSWRFYHWSRANECSLYTYTQVVFCLSGQSNSLVHVVVCMYAPCMYLALVLGAVCVACDSDIIDGPYVSRCMY